MAIIYSYPTVIPTSDDLVLGTDVNKAGQPTKNFTIQSIIDIVTAGSTGIGAVIKLGDSAKDPVAPFNNQSIIDLSSITGNDSVNFPTINSTNITNAAAIATATLTASGNITSNAIVQADTFQTTAGAAIWSTTVLSGFSSITTESLVINGAVSGTSLIIATDLAAASDINIASTLAIKTYVDDKVANLDTLSELLAKRPSPLSNPSNTTGGNDILVSAGDDITFTNTSKILMGTTAVDNFEIYSDSANSIVIDRSPGALKLQTSLLSVKNEADTETILSGTAGAAVDLYFNNAKKFETLTGGAKVTGAFEATGSGTFASLVNTGTYTAGNGVGAAGQILSSTGTGTSWIPDVALYNWSYEGTNIPTGTAMTVTDGANITTTWDAANYDLSIAVTGIVNGSGAANQVTFWSDTDTLTGTAGFTFAGGATGQVTVAGILRAGTLSDGTFSGSAGTYTGGVSITSALFVGDATALLIPPIPPWPVGTTANVQFQGNASTANQLKLVGTVSMSGDTVASGLTYTNGGPVPLVSTIADSVVYNKTLSGFNATNAVVADGDSIIQALQKLQGQITTLPQGIIYQGVWEAGTAGITSTAISGTTITLNTAPTQTVVVGMTVTAPGISSAITVTGVTSQTNIQVSASVTLGSGITVTFSRAGGYPDLTVAGKKVNGHYYVVSVAGNATPNSPTSLIPNEWDVRDWCVFADDASAGGVDEWQKIDNSSLAGGTGTANTITKWTNNQTIGNSTITDNGSTVTIADTVDFITKGNNTFGNTSADASTFLGNVTLNENLILAKGLSIPSLADPYGAAGQVLTSGGGVGVANSWTTLTVGTVTSVSEGTGITVSGTAADPIVNIDYVGTDNAILSATAYSGTVITDTNQIWFNDVNDYGVANTVSYAPINQLPFDQYSSWNLSDGTNTAIIASTNTAKILGGTGITSVVSPTDKSATLSIDYVGTDNAILSAGGGTPIATDELLFNNADVASGTVQRASIASIVDLGNETLAQVLSNGNTTGNSNNIVVQKNITFSDSNGSNSGNIIMGIGSDMSMGYDGDYGLELVSAAGALSGGIRMGSPLIQLRDLTSPNPKKYFDGATGGAVKLYYDGTQKFATTSTGIEVGSGDVNVPPTLVLPDNGTNNLTLTFGNNGGPEIIHNYNSGVSSMTLRNDGTMFLMNTTNSDSKAIFGVDIDLNPQNQAGSVVSGVRISQSTGSTAEGTKTRIFGDLQTDRSIIHGSTGAAAGVVNIAGQGGTFTKLFTSVSGGSIAFTIDRPQSGAMVFDVMMTSDTSTTCSVAKKYTVVKQYSADPIVYKILDTGPDSSVAGSPTDFTPVFTQPSSIEPTKIQCFITPSVTALQKIGITIDLGFGKDNATVVMNT